MLQVSAHSSNGADGMTFIIDCDFYNFIQNLKSASLLSLSLYYNLLLLCDFSICFVCIIVIIKARRRLG